MPVRLPIACPPFRSFCPLLYARRGAKRRESARSATIYCVGKCQEIQNLVPLCVPARIRAAMPRIFPQAGRKLWKNPPILLENCLFLYSYVTSCPFPLQSNGCFVILIFSKVWKGEYAVKRVFALCLAVFLILTACMLPAAAAPAAKQVFFDQAEIRNPGAVRMLVDLGLISGYTDGSFRPAAPVTREEIAKVIARLCTDDPQAENLTAFADTAGSWGNLYVCFCAERGVITGDGQGNFRPKDAVTARELAKMLLVVLGEDGTR